MIGPVWLRAILVGASLLTSYGAAVVWDYNVASQTATTLSEVVEARDRVRDRAAQKFKEWELASILEGKSSGYELPVTVNQFEGGVLRQIVEQNGIAPLGFQPMSDLMLCHDGAHQIRFRSDRFGFRNPDEIWEQRTDTVLVGGEPVLGSCVIDDATISGVLRQHGVTVANLGISHGGAIHYAAIAKTFLPVLRPKRVVLALHPTDATKATESSVYSKVFFGDATQPYFSDAQIGSLPLGLSSSVISVYDAGRRFLRYPGNDAVRVGSKSPAAIPAYKPDWTWRNSLALTNAGGRLAKLLFGPELPETTRIAINTVDSYCRERACDAMYIIFPPNPTWIPQPGARAYAQAIKEHVHRLGRGSFIDLAESRPQSLPFFAEGEEFYTPAAYAAIAELVRKSAPPSH